MRQTEASRLRENERKGRPPEEGLAICLSGGGYRAMLFHAGVLRRLNEAGLLRDAKCISSVSGGSITAAVLGMHWRRLRFNKAGVATNFDAVVIEQVRRMARKAIDVPAFLVWLLRLGNLLPLPLHPHWIVERAYRRTLFGKATLQDLPADGPRFIFNATNLQSGARWAFEREAMYDYRVGTVLDPTVPLAKVVAASSAFPPFLAPVLFRPKGVKWESIRKAGFNDLAEGAYRKRIVLADGGVYGNLGMEELRYYQSGFVSDAGKKLGVSRRPWQFAPVQLLRVNGVIYSQVRNNQARYFVGDLDAKHKEAAYDRWGRFCYMGTPIPSGSRNLEGVLDCPPEATERLASMGTRLWRVSRAQQDRLLNWGYARCDYTLRVQRDLDLPPPRGFPYPGGVGSAKRATAGPGPDLESHAERPT